MKKFNLWKASITIHDGEFEYSNDVFIRGAESEEEAMKEAQRLAQATLSWGEGEDDKATPCEDRENSWEEKGGYRIVELESVRKIESVDELLSSLYVVDCNKLEVGS